MELIQTHTVHCAFCAEPIELVVDLSAGDQEYLEDCSVCCRPLVVRVSVNDDGAASVEVRNENE